MVPKEYAYQCIVTTDVPYNVPPERHEGTYARTGKLEIGRVVWTRTRPPQSTAEAACIPGYVEGVGEVELDPTCLLPFRH